MNKIHLIDVHCHLNRENYGRELEAVIEQAKKAGILAMVNACVKPEQWQEALDLRNSHPSVRCALGIHPFFAMPGSEEKLADLYAPDIRPDGIGETGLDSRSPVPMDRQIDLFCSHLKAAKELNLPVVIHSVRAVQETLACIKKTGIPDAGGIIHSFGGSADLADIYIKLGLSFSLGGILTMSGGKKRAGLMARIFPDYFMLETDSPDMLPVPARTEPPAKNVPANIIYSLQAAAELLGISPEETGAAAAENAEKMFLRGKSLNRQRT